MNLLVTLTNSALAPADPVFLQSIYTLVRTPSPSAAGNYNSQSSTAHDPAELNTRKTEYGDLEEGTFFSVTLPLVLQKRWKLVPVSLSFLWKINSSELLIFTRVLSHISFSSMTPVWLFCVLVVVMNLDF